MGQEAKQMTGSPPEAALVVPEEAQRLLREFAAESAVGRIKHLLEQPDEL